MASVDPATGKVTGKVAGAATITATCQGKTDSYQVLVKPEKVKVTLAKSTGSGRVTLKWKRTKGADGYEIQAAAAKKKLGKAKPIRVAKASAVKKTITKLSNGKKLKGKTTVYIRIRAYTKAGGQKIYGSYSQTKKCNVK